MPDTFPDNTIGVIATAEHFVCDAGAATTFGFGFTVMLKVFDGPVQPGTP